MLPRISVSASSMSSSMITEKGFLLTASAILSRAVLPRKLKSDSPSSRRETKTIIIGLDSDTSSERAEAIFFLPTLSGPINNIHMSPLDPAPRCFPLPTLHW
ncbi:hypothetical protein RGQ29_032323 [Quercus rubra]|uniref:Uncharacterized protein n=1 Tax=Quercus rubra TaxID=3512 RepID=A0AAN7DRP5_QUERU|nr:hypothetical protein RGQ29_032323 [Quercus rubra]